MRIELAMQATLLACCISVLIIGALCYALDAVLWLRRRLAARRARQEAIRAKWKGILS